MVKPVISKVLGLFVVCGLTSVAGGSSWAQEKGQAPAAPSSCTRENALDLIQQQIDLTKTFDNDLRRIAVLLRAADLIWPYRQEKARATFTEAFEIATRNFKEKGDKPRNEGRLIVGVPDQRYTVITAIARRDFEWSSKLSKLVLEDDAREAEAKTAKDKSQDTHTAEKLLGAAHSLLPGDPTAALGFAKSSLNYPSTLYLPMFLFKLSEVNRGAADQFYQEALVAYARAPMDQFLYLSSYPFAAKREIGEMPSWTIYTVPASLQPNPSLQRLFVQTLLSRARELVENPTPSSASARYSEASQIFMALSRLEPQITTTLPDLNPPLRELKGNIFALLSQGEQQRAGETMADPPPKKTFDEQVEAADRLADAGRREFQIAMAILNSSDAESLAQIEAAAAKIDDLALRVKVLSQVCFDRAQRALKANRIEEARQLAAKVDQLDQRAFLYSRIATESMKQTKNDALAREMLEDVLTAIAKAPHTEVTARAQLAVAYLYSSFDPSRAIAVLGDAVKTINRVEAIDLSSDTVQQRIEGKVFGRYSMLQSPGFSPETAFREIGKVDFDGTLYLASNLADKSLRAMTSLALAEQCLKDQAAKPKPKVTNPARTKP
jgi:hypothetical protein